MRIAVRTDRVRSLIVGKQKDDVGTASLSGIISQSDAGGKELADENECLIHGVP